MGTKLQKAPVYFTIGQVQHNPLLGLDSFISRFQEQMRKLGYPDFNQSVQLGVSTSPSSGDAAINQATAMQPMSRFIFCNVKNTAGFILFQNSISFQTTQYETFDDFLREMLKGIKLLDEVVGGLSFTDRIGLRYLDAVVPSNDDDLSLYLPPEFLGLPGRLKAPGFLYSFTEALIEIPEVGGVTTRTIIRNDKVGFPRELNPEPLRLSERFQTVNKVHAVIDTDASYTERDAMDISIIKKRFSRLHDEIEKSFKATVTDFARASWQ